MVDPGISRGGGGGLTWEGGGCRRGEGMGEGRGEGAGEDVCLLPRKLLPLAIKILFQKSHFMGS